MESLRVSKRPIKFLHILIDIKCILGIYYFSLSNNSQIHFFSFLLIQKMIIVSDMPTCLLCACLSGSVYCEETDIESVPVLPKETGYLYARFNKIKKIKTSDFAEIRKYIFRIYLELTG